jgi:hypothetical protein
MYFVHVLKGKEWKLSKIHNEIDTNHLLLALNIGVFKEMN